MFLSLHTLWALIQRDLRIFLPTYKTRIINAVIFVIINLVIFEKIMPALGLAVGYAAFTAASNIGSWGLFDIMENVATVVADIEGERSISYYLTLPLSQTLVFLRLALSNAISAFLVVILFIPISKLVLWNTLDMSAVSFPKLFLIVMLSSLFYGMFSLSLAAKTKKLHGIGNIWRRVIFPLWFIGCYQFPWNTLHKISPVMAYVDLLNPIVYCMEGTRAAFLGQEGSINFWYSVAALCVFCMIAGYFGIKNMKQRLDCL